MDAATFFRMQAAKEAWERLTDADKQAYLSYLSANRRHLEVMQSLSRLEQSAVKNQHSWLGDFGANVAGNAVWSGLTWLCSKILGKP